MVSAYLMSSFRKNGKQVASMKKAFGGAACQRHRAPGAGGEHHRRDHRCVRQHHRPLATLLWPHPEQLTRPTPYVHLNSPHANWCWQMDASVCVIYYLPKGGALIREMKESEFYAGKPENWNRIAGQMVIRYLMTEGTAGA